MNIPFTDFNALSSRVAYEELSNMIELQKSTRSSSLEERVYAMNILRSNDFDEEMLAEEIAGYKKMVIVN